MRKCMSTLKVCFESRERAARAAERHRGSSSSGTMEAYPCKFCGKWHITHRKQIFGKRRNRR